MKFKVGAATHEALKQKEADKEQEPGSRGKLKTDIWWPQDKPHDKHLTTEHVDQEEELSKTEPGCEVEHVAAGGVWRKTERKKRECLIVLKMYLNLSYVPAVATP
jgi:hypothetical protein